MAFLRSFDIRSSGMTRGSALSGTITGFSGHYSQTSGGIAVGAMRAMKYLPFRALAAYVLLAGLTGLSHADEPSKPIAVAPHGDKTGKLPADLSGHKRVGKASVYAKRFAGHKMADGAPMQAQGDNAASKTLPIGTTAKVTNVETGASAVVKIEDRGPYIKGRIVDLSPSTAQKIGIDSKDGVAKVSVEPIAVPLPNGEMKAGVAAHDPANH
jgi:rare lipoprotein A